MPATREIDQVGKREDLSDIIAVADAKATVFTSMIRKGKAPTNTLFDWQMDAYDPTSTDGVVDGADVTEFEDAAKNRVRAHGRVQKFRKTPMVTDMAETVSDIAGVASEFATAKAKKSLELKRNIEATLLSDNESQADNGQIPYKTRGVGKWIQTAAQSDLPVDAAFRTPAASIVTKALSGFGEDDLRGIMKSRFDQCGTSDELVGLVGSTLKATISDFTRFEPDKASNTHVRRFNSDAEGDMTISTTVDFYVSDFGSLELHLSSFVPDVYRGYILDMRHWELRTKRAPGYKDLPDMGGGPRGLIDAILGLACLTPLSSGKIVGS